MRNATRLINARTKGFLQLSIFALIGIIGITIGMQSIHIHQTVQEIQTIRKWMER